MDFNNNDINQVINNIPNINGFVHNLNMTLEQLQQILIKFNFSLYHHNNINQYGVSTVLIETDSVENHIYSYENISQLILTFVSIFYFLSILSYPYLNRSTRYYSNNIDYITYKFLWPMFFGLIMVPYTFCKFNIDIVKYFFRKYKYASEVTMNNRYKLELNDKDRLSFEFGFIEDNNEYSSIYSKLNKYHSINQNEQNNNIENDLSEV